MEEQILKKHQLKRTSVRKGLLTIFLNSETALSHAMIEKQVEYDRVTLYRTLNTFEEKGIVHKIMNFEGVAEYALCASGCAEDHHHDHHIHFYCEKCRKTSCMPEEYTPKIELPTEYQVKEIQFSVKGVCPTCK